jgi:hypothetical protein
LDIVIPLVNALQAEALAALSAAIAKKEIQIRRENNEATRDSSQRSVDAAR